MVIVRWSGPTPPQGSPSPAPRAMPCHVTATEHSSSGCNPLPVLTLPLRAKKRVSKLVYTNQKTIWNQEKCNSNIEPGKNFNVNLCHIFSHMLMFFWEHLFPFYHIYFAFFNMCVWAKLCCVVLCMRVCVHVRVRLCLHVHVRSEKRGAALWGTICGD